LGGSKIQDRSKKKTALVGKRAGNGNAIYHGAQKAAELPTEGRCQLFGAAVLEGVQIGWETKKETEKRLWAQWKRGPARVQDVQGGNLTIAKCQSGSRIKHTVSRGPRTGEKP